MKSKTKIISLFLLLSISVVSAQQMTVGFRLGVTGSKIKMSDKEFYSDNEKEKPLLTPSFTGFCEKSLAPNWLMQGEISVLTRGLRYTVDNTYSSGTTYHSDSRLQLMYLEAAFMPKYTFGSQPNFSFFGGLGINYMLNGKTKKRATTVSKSVSLGKNTVVSTTVNDVDIANTKSNRLDVVVPIGASVSYQISGYHLYCDIRYMLGVLDISKEEPSEETSFNRGWGISVGAGIPIASLKTTKVK